MADNPWDVVSTEGQAAAPADDSGWDVAETREQTLGERNAQFNEDTTFGSRLASNARRGWLGLRAAFSGVLNQPLIERGAQAEAEGDVIVGTDPTGRPMYASEMYLPSQLPGVLDAQKKLGTAATQNLAETVAPLQAEMAQIPQRPATQSLMGAKSFGEGVGALFTDPLGVIGDIGVQSGVQMAPGLIAGILARNPIVSAAAIGGSSAANEYGSGVIDYLSNQKVNVSDPAAIEAALADPETARQAVSYAKTRAAIVGTVDAASGGVAGRSLVPQRLIGNALGREAANIAVAQPVAQAAFGAGGEASAQLATTGKIKPGDVLAEAVGELATVPAEAGPFAVHRAVDAVRGRSEAAPAAAAPAAEWDVESVEPAAAAQPAPAPVEPPPLPQAQQPPVAATPAPAAAPAQTAPPEPQQAAPAAAQQAPAQAPAPAPAPQAQPAETPAATGQRQTVSTAAGRKVDTEFQVVDLSQLKQATGDLQNRDRSRAASDVQIQQIASGLDPERLGDSAEADRGAPIVGPDNTIESGNGRVSAIERAYASMPDRAEAYRQFLRQRGHNIDGMERPVLVRRRMTEMTPEERRAFVIESNTPATAKLNTVEQARSDADSIGDDTVSLFQGGDVTQAGNREFVRAFVSKLSPGEQAAMVGPDGALSQEGSRRIQNAMLARAYGSPELLSKLTEDQDNNIRSIGGAMLDNAGAWAQLRAEVKAGRVKPEFDITDRAVEAARIASDLRVRGQTPQEFINQTDAFNPLDPITERLIRAFYNPQLTRAASRDGISNVLSRYVADARRQTTDAGLFGNEDQVTPQRVLDNILSSRAAANAPNQTGLFDAAESPATNNASGESAASVEAINRSRDERAAGQDRMLIDRDGSVRSLAGVDAVDTVARDGQVIVQRGVGKSDWTVLSSGQDMSESVVAGKVNRARPALDGDVEAEQDADQDDRAPGVVDLSDEFEDTADDGHTDTAGQSGRPEALLDEAEAPGEAGRVHSDREPAQNQRGRGTPPETERVSFTNRRSWFEQAFTDAGVDHEQATLWPIERQFDVLSKLVKTKFGITTQKTGQLQGRFAVDQLLDLYRNLQFMAHTLHMPTEGMGLGGTLHLLLQKQIKYLGAFYPTSHKVEGVTIPAGTVALPKRSNSFAHEWMHALDHYLAKKLDEAGGFTFLTQKVKKEGIDSEPQSAAEAFVTVMDNLFHDQAALASKMLALQNAIDTGAPSVKAKAEAQMQNILRGNAKPNVTPSEFRKSSASYGNPQYWANPQELLARAFEAYTAFKVEASGGSTEAIAKGDFAYLSNADERLAKTFPKAEERNRIFAAFDRLFDQMAKEQLIAQGVAAGVPGNMQIFDPRVWDKTPARQKEYAGLAGAIRQTIDEIRTDYQGMQRRKERPANPKPVWHRVQDVLRFAMYSQRSVFRVLERRYRNSQALRELANNLVTAPGSDRTVKRVFEESVEQRVKQGFNRLGNIVARYQLEKLDTAGLRTLRDLLISESVPNAPANIRSAAAELRKFLDTEWYRNQQAGIDIGYARNGYLPRLLDMARVMTDGHGFVSKAAKVYEVIFDTAIGADPADVMSRDGGVAAFIKQAKLTGFATEAKALSKIARQISRLEGQIATADDPDVIQAKIAELTEKLEEQIGDIYDQVREAYGVLRANNWLGELKKTEANDFDSMSPDSNYTKNRKLPPEADKLLEDYYINDPLEAIQTYVFQSARRTEYATRFGAKGEKLKELFDRMAEEGVSVEDQAFVSDMVKSLTGRGKSNLPPAFAGFLNYVHALGTMALLPRAVMSSLGEPTGAAIRTGNIVDTLKPYLNMVKGVAGSIDAKQWADLSRAIGAVSNGFAETLAANRFGGTFDSSIKTDMMMARFFKRTFLTGLTNAQRSAILPIAHQFMMLHAANIQNGNDVANSRALLAELGVEDAADFSDWLMQSDSIPDVNELYDSNGIETPHGTEYMTAVNRFLDQTIQNPKGYDRPLYANNPIGRLMYGILSFSMSFWSNIWKRQGALIKGIAERKGVPAAVGYTALNLTPSLLSLFLVQTVVSTIREAMFNPDRWDEWEKKGTLAENMLQLGFTRAFSFGLADPVIQAFNGLKYQRDLANLPLGAVPGFALQSIQNILQPLVRNSEKTNNAEFKSAQGAYQLLATPLVVQALSMAPGGKLADPLYGLGMMYLTSPGARDRVATAVVGEKDSRRKKQDKDARTTGRDDKARSTGR